MRQGGWCVLVAVISICIMGMAFGAVPAEAGYLYAGTSNPGKVYKYNGSSWQAISESLGYAVLDIIEFEGKLFAATMSSAIPPPPNPPGPYSGVGKVWRYEGGTSWTIVKDNLDDQVCDLEVWDGDLYAGTAWSGGRLYRYDRYAETFELVGEIPDWYGIRAMYASSYGYLQLGEINVDKFGRFDGYTFYDDLNHEGSCIYDFAEFNDALYGAAYNGRLFRSTDGIEWSMVLGYSSDRNIWELEPFQGHLYMSYHSGLLARLNTSQTKSTVWTAPDGIISMVADGDSVLYLGIGAEAGALWHSETDGVGSVYAYRGNGSPLLIADQMGTGVQCLYIPLGAELAVDIKPGSYPNSINPKSWGKIPVAILSTEDFDAPDEVDRYSLTFGPTGVEDSLAFCGRSGEDVNDDGYDDLICHFYTQETGFEAGHTEGVLKGKTVEGTPIEGRDSVNIVTKGKGK
ncbi:MAG: hypothetical protein GTO40_06615 [Deltaproteobacteria bacterium]|nr:hypothetical protein [Deltaproteobacteria bacterium]